MHLSVWRFVNHRTLINKPPNRHYVNMPRFGCANRHWPVVESAYRSNQAIGFKVTSSSNSTSWTFLPTHTLSGLRNFRKNQNGSLQWRAYRNSWIGNFVKMNRATSARVADKEPLRMAQYPDDYRIDKSYSEKWIVSSPLGILWKEEESTSSSLKCTLSLISFMSLSW